MKKIAFALIFLLTFIFSSLQFNNYFDVNAAPSSSGKRAIVKFSGMTPGFARRSIVRGQGATITESTRIPNTQVINVPEDKMEKVLAALNKNIFIEYAEEDFIAEAQGAPNDPLFQNQWGLERVSASNGWDISHGAPDVRIAILDTGVNSYHPDLNGKITSSVNCIYYSCPKITTNDPAGHATHVAGIAAAATNNGLGIAGVNWNSQIISVKVLDDRGSGYYSWIANGIYWAADNGIDVINLSLGGGGSSRTLESAINYAWSRGVVLVAAAGNNGRNMAFYPAFYTNTIAVAATDGNDKRASFSNYGSWVDVAAPGVDVLSTYHDTYDYLSGTSMSTPMVSGLTALVISNNPNFSNVQIRNLVETSSDKITGTGSLWKYGRINICSALGCGEEIVSPTLTPTPTSTNSPSPSPSPTPTATQSPTPTSTNTPLPSPTPTLISTATPTLVASLSPTPTPTPSPTQTNLPWWCKYIPWHYTCQ